MVAGKLLRTKLSEKVKQEQQALRTYLFDLAKKTNKNIEARVEDIEKKLANDFNNLKEFVGFVESLNNSKIEATELEQKKGTLEQMKGVLGKYRNKDDSFGVKSTVSDVQGWIENLNTKLTDLQGRLNNAETEASTRKAHNVETLVARIEEEKTKLNEYIEKSQSETLMNKDIPAKDALDELSKLKRRYDDTWKKI